MSKIDHPLLVSISCITHNHEKFITQAIESFLMQETNFEFEIVIGDDCSTDRTKEIILSYVDKFPGKIRFINRLKNIGSAPNFMQTIKECNGKYIALCEGDDYWTDPLKLQKQVDFLEENSEYVLTSTQYEIINDSKEEIIFNQSIATIFQNHSSLFYEITNDNIFDPFILQTHTILFKNKLIDENLYMHKLCGDVFLISNLLLKGKGACLNFNSGVYRIHDGGIFSKKTEIEKSAIEFDRAKVMNQYYRGKYKSILTLYNWNTKKLHNVLYIKKHTSFKSYTHYFMFKLFKINLL